MRSAALVPADLDRRHAVSRAATALAINRAHPEDGSAADILRKTWPHDRAALSLIERAVSVPATATGTGWAAELIGPAGIAAAFIANLGGAAAALIPRGLGLDLSGIAQIGLPYLGTLAAATWVVEGQPIPVSAETFARNTLGPQRKVAAIVTLTDEMVSHSAQNAELLVGSLLKEASSRALDAALLDAAAASTSRPAGLRNGISAVTAGASFAADIDGLISAVVTGGGSPDGIVFVAHPSRAARFRLAAGAAEGSFDVIQTGQLATNLLVCLDAGAFASAIDAPDIATSREGIIHMEDAVPLPIASVGTPNTVAAPVRSLWQTDSIGLRLVMPCAWSLRVPGALSWVTVTGW